MVIDCDSCEVRGSACGECVVSVILGAAPGPLELGPEEHRAITALAEAGLVPALRMVPSGGESAAG